MSDVQDSYAIETQTTSIMISAFPPFPKTLTLSVPSTTPISQLYPLLRERYPELPPSLEKSTLHFKTQFGSIPPQSALVSSLHAVEESSGRTQRPLVTLNLLPKALGNCS